jgi:MoxR-like ATPase
MTEINLAASQQKLLAIEGSINAHVAERRDAVRAMLLAFCVQEHVFFFGPPGTAKTQMIECLRSCITGARQTYKLLHKFCTADELIGPMDLVEFQQNRVFKRNLEGGIAQVEIGFLDEVFKANSAVLNTLLPILNERRLDNAQIPLRMCGSASNEFPAENTLQALYDRFLFRDCVSYVSNHRTKMSLRRRKAGLAKQAQAFVPPCTLSLDEWDAIAADVDRVILPDAILEAQLKLEKLLKDQGMVVSDRRGIQALRVLKAEAWLNGEKEASQDSLQALRYVYWDTLAQRDTLIPLLEAMERTAIAGVLAVMDSALREWQDRPSDPFEYRAIMGELESKLTTARAEAKRLQSEGKFGKRANDKINDRGKELREALDTLVRDLASQYSLGGS